LKENVMLRDPTESYAQRLLISALGDYEHLSPTPVPSAIVVQIMNEFDISEDSTRTALSRLTRRGYLVRFAEKRRTAYRMSELGAALIEDGRKRIAEFGHYPPWNGRWTIVAFSVAEHQRDVRHQLRAQLRALGFAPFYNGIWIAAHADPQTVTAQITAVEHADIAVFEGSLQNQSEPMMGKLHETWKLTSVKREYDDFIETFTPLAERIEHEEVAPAEAFIIRTRLLDAWRVFPRIDPDLPQQLLPQDWPRLKAHRLFTGVYDALQPSAERHFHAMLTGALERA
jgi:phenylacetic acid degradation operon negative regulatory protein